jgi:hypothetical protein
MTVQGPDRDQKTDWESASRSNNNIPRAPGHLKIFADIQGRKHRVNHWNNNACFHVVIIKKSSAEYRSFILGKPNDREWPRVPILG